MRSQRYDFSSIEPEEIDPEIKYSNDKDPRVNFRIAQCCMNCHFYRIGQTMARNSGIGNSKNGICIFKLKSPQQYRKETGTTISNIEAYKIMGALPVHPTNMCDGYQLKKSRRVLNNIAKASQRPFDALGNLLDGEDFDITIESDIERDLI